jgi:ATP-binding cassette subfamily B protein
MGWKLLKLYFSSFFVIKGLVHKTYRILTTKLIGFQTLSLIKYITLAIVLYIRNQTLFIVVLILTIVSAALIYIFKKP